jgi:hypothetical protein
MKTMHCGSGVIVVLEFNFTTILFFTTKDFFFFDNTCKFIRRP